jgi:hypothetical protein
MLVKKCKVLILAFCDQTSADANMLQREHTFLQHVDPDSLSAWMRIRIPYLDADPDADPEPIQEQTRRIYHLVSPD